MAEYVRRRRPPASHPYWARLDDRAHPPRLFLRIAIPTLFGLLLGLYGGLRSPFSISDAVHLAATCAAILSTVAFFTAIGAILFDRSRHFAPRERWMTAPVFSSMIAAFCFAIAFVACFVMHFWYSLCSGQGPWFGMLIGCSPACLLASLAAIGRRKQWQDRQRAWPRWERMRTPLGRSRLTVSSVEEEPTGATQGDAATAVSESPAHDAGPTTNSSRT